MAQADWITYGNAGGAKAAEIAKLREMFGNVGAFNPVQTQRSFYGGDQQNTANVWDLQNDNVSAIFKQLGINPANTTYAFAEPRQQSDGFGNTSPYLDDDAMLQAGYTPTGVTYQLPGMADPERDGKKGAYTLRFNADGTIADVVWDNHDLSKGWFGDNMSWLGPLLVGLGAPAAFGAVSSMAGVGGTAAAGGAGGAAPAAAAGPGYFGGLSSTPAAAVPGMGGGAGLNIGAAGPLAAGSAMMPTLGAAGTAALAAGGGAAAGGGLSGLLGSVLGGDGGDGEGGSGLGLLASLINAFSQNRQGSAQEDWADRLYQDRSQFLERLARTYSNPEEYLSGPEYTAASGITLDQLQRKDAARGRLATDVERQKLMQDYALQSLGNYRSGLSTAAGLSPTQGLADLSVTGQANKYGTFNAPISELARLFEGNNSFDFDDLLDDIIGGWF